MPDNQRVRFEADGGVVVERLQHACRTDALSLAIRAFGGPQGAAFASAADEAETDCLRTAHREGARWLEAAYGLRSRCVRKQRTGGQCDLAGTDLRLATRRARAATRIATRCDGLREQGLRDLIALLPYVERMGFTERIPDWLEACGD